MNGLGTVVDWIFFVDDIHMCLHILILNDCDHRKLLTALLKLNLVSALMREGQTKG